MFNFLKHKQSFAPKSEPTSTKELIDAIHHEFETAGDMLLKEAKEIIAGLGPVNEEKVRLLKSVGFGNVKEATDGDKLLAKKRQIEEVALAIEYFSTKFPQYKFIDDDKITAICEKYDLVFGESSQYTGFVPQKNLDEIAKFFETENEINVQYTEQWSGSVVWNGSREKPITKDEYTRGLERNEMLAKSEYKSRYCYYYNKRKVPLSIAAPLKDMKKEGYKLKGRRFEREIPDPVVFAPVMFKNTKLYCIITSWGDESTDENVVNQKMN